MNTPSSPLTAEELAGLIGKKTDEIAPFFHDYLNWGPNAALKHMGYRCAGDPLIWFDPDGNRLGSVGNLIWAIVALRHAALLERLAAAEGEYRKVELLWKEATVAADDYKQQAEAKDALWMGAIARAEAAEANALPNSDEYYLAQIDDLISDDRFAKYTQLEKCNAVFDIFRPVAQETK